ncbi:hypothetical protein [Dictyobacter kobayashii]|uniref:DUF4382 domain-containing protein n=1 Tax=Dictyobacter kobayashii TaxID=2014872 RepID=A0A402APY7_9CHLR|nr:hypothetical protein [Dictyobacter kobayashii]GCE21241.1 hypothetical protein KDK_50410 [Dictyobacter kobayashii]
MREELVLFMKVRVSIPVDLRIPTAGEFHIDKQTSSDQQPAEWENVVLASGVTGGDYLADLEPGIYQKSISAVGALPGFASTFEITPEGRYIDEAGQTFKIDEDGTLLQQ